MFSAALIKALQIYGIAIAISMLVAVLIKVLVLATSRVKPAAQAPALVARPAPPAAGDEISGEIPGEVLAAIAAAIAVTAGPHRILHIVESQRSWSNAGRIAQHAHQPRH